MVTKITMAYSRSEKYANVYYCKLKNGKTSWMYDFMVNGHVSQRVVGTDADGWDAESTFAEKENVLAYVKSKQKIGMEFKKDLIEDWQIAKDAWSKENRLIVLQIKKRVIDQLKPKDFCNREDRRYKIFLIELFEEFVDTNEFLQTPTIIEFLQITPNQMNLENPLLHCIRCQTWKRVKRNIQHLHKNVNIFPPVKLGNFRIPSFLEANTKQLIIPELECVSI